MTKHGTASMNGRKRIGVFTRLLDPAADPAARYRDALEQIAHAERVGCETAWVAQHHLDGHEGGLPSPFVFLAQAAARTSTIRLGTGILTLALDQPLRVAEDAAVLDLLSGGRVELGFGTGGSPGSFAAFGLEAEARGEVFGRNLGTFLAAVDGEALAGGGRLYPAAPQLRGRLWQATFSAEGGARAGRAGDGLMLSRTQPRPPEAPAASLADVQDPIVDAYLAGLPAGATPRIMASRSIFVADRRDEALRHAAAGLERFAARLKAAGRPAPSGTLAEVIAASDLHVGTPEDVVASLAADRSLARATDVAAQVHSADPPHALTMRSIELWATIVAPALGWTSAAAGACPAAPSLVAVGR